MYFNVIFIHTSAHQINCSSRLQNPFLSTAEALRHQIWLIRWLCYCWCVGDFFYQCDFWGSTKDMNFKHSLQTACNAHLRTFNFFSSFLAFLWKICKIQFFCKRDFSGSINGPNFKLFMQRAFGEWSLHIYFSLFFIFHIKYKKKITLCRQKFSSAASLQPGSCAEDPSDVVTFNV